jgi:hypothetical protein
MSSSTGWTNDEIGLTWVKEIFHKGTEHSTAGKYRLLILGQHSSHNTVEFISFCEKHNTITLYMPPTLIPYPSASRCGVFPPAEVGIQQAD